MDELGTDLRCMLASDIKIYGRAIRLLTACYDIVRTKFSPRKCYPPHTDTIHLLIILRGTLTLISNHPSKRLNINRDLKRDSKLAQHVSSYVTETIMERKLEKMKIHEKLQMRETWKKAELGSKVSRTDRWDRNWRVSRSRSAKCLRQ